MKKRKIFRKALLLLPLTLVLALQVKAKTIYSEYELIGTTEEYKEDTELIKYTPIVMHRFYTLKKTNEVFMPHYYKSEEAPYKESFIYNRTRTLSNEKDPLAITYKRVAFKHIDYQKNIINNIEIINNDISEESTETHISVYNNDMVIYDKRVELSDEVNMELKNNLMIYNPRVIIEFDKDINLSLTIKYMNDTEVVYEQSLEPDDYSSNEQLVLEVKMEPDYERYMTDSGLLTLEEAQNSDYHKYYTNEVLTYKFYNLEKEYYEDSRENHLNGYEYDEKDDYIVYDIYERAILEITEDEKDSQKTEKPSKEEPEEIEKEPEKPLPQPEETTVRPQRPVEKPIESTEPKEEIIESENPPEEEKEPSTNEPEKAPIKPPIINGPDEIIPILPNDEDKDSKLEMSPPLNNNQSNIIDENKSEEKELETPSNIKEEKIPIDENNKVETINEIVYVLKNENDEPNDIVLNEEDKEETKIEAKPLVNEVTTNEKKSTTDTSLALKITLRIIISLIVLLIIRQIFCKVSANKAK